MQIAFVNAYQGGVNRGAERYVYELSKKLTKHAQVELISGNIKPIKRWRVLWRFFIDASGLSILFFTIKNLYKIVKKRYDYVIPLNSGWQPAILRIVTWFYGGKMIISGQSGIGWDDANNLWCFPNVFVALSPEALEWAQKVNPLVKSVYIPNGVDLDKFNPVGSKITTGLRKPVVLCVGALTPSKRIDLTIKAVAKLGNTSLLLVGQGEAESEIRLLGEKLLGDNFKLINLSFDKMPDVYRSADVFTLVSKPEHSFEMVLLEAMSSSLPVVANDDPIRRLIVGNAGLFVDPNDTHKYCMALKDALSKKWSDVPRNQAKKFSWEMIGEKYLELFNKLL